MKNRAFWIVASILVSAGIAIADGDAKQDEGRAEKKEVSECNVCLLAIQELAYQASRPREKVKTGGRLGVDNKWSACILLLSKN